jgi:O-antigen/teichoic acid export membrane protein
MRWIVNIATSYLRFGTGMLTVFLMMPFVIASIGMEQFGLWSLLFAVVGLFGLLDLGLATAAVKHVAEATGSGCISERNRSLATLLVVYSGIGLLCLGLVSLTCSIAGSWFDLDAGRAEQFGAVLFVLGVAVSLNFPLSLFKAILTGAGHMHVVNIVETVTTLVNAGLMVVLLHAGWGLKGMALSTAGTMALSGVVLIPLAYRFVDGLSLSPRLFNFRQVSPLLSFSICVFVANVATLMMLRMDPVVIKFFLSLSSVAVYAVAAKIAEYTLLLNKQFSNALMPLISRSRGAADPEKIRAVLTDGTRYLLAIAVPLSVLILLYADDFVGQWLGTDFEESVPLVRLLTIASLLSAVQLNAANVMGMTGRHRAVATAMAGCAVLNVALSIVFISFAGLEGVAVATLISTALLQTMTLLPLACRQIEVRFRDFFVHSLLPVLPPLIPMVSAWWLLEQLGAADSLLGIAARASFCGVLYLTVFAVTALKEPETRFLRTFLPPLRRATVAQGGG